jgi:hypothetical protein
VDLFGLSAGEVEEGDFCRCHSWGDGLGLEAIGKLDRDEPGAGDSLEHADGGFFRWLSRVCELLQRSPRVCEPEVTFSIGLLSGLGVTLIPWGPPHFFLKQVNSRP